MNYELCIMNYALILFRYFSKFIDGCLLMWHNKFGLIGRKKLLGREGKGDV